MKKVVLSLLTLVSVLFFISCGSKPAADEKTTEAPVVEAPAENTNTDPTEDVDTSTSDVDAILAELNDARNAALEAGAEKIAPQQLQDLDDLYNKFKDDPTSLDENSKKLLKGYKLLADYCKAVNAKNEIDEKGFADYAKADYDKGVECLAKVEAVYESGDLDNEEVFASASDAYAHFNSVLIVAYKSLQKLNANLLTKLRKRLTV